MHIWFLWIEGLSRVCDFNAVHYINLIRVDLKIWNVSFLMLLCVCVKTSHRVGGSFSIFQPLLFMWKHFVILSQLRWQYNDTFRKFQSPKQASDGLPDHLKDCVLLFRPFRKAFLQNATNLHSDLVFGENVNLQVRRSYAQYLGCSRVAVITSKIVRTLNADTQVEIESAISKYVKCTDSVGL